ncbi:MAG: 2-dehydro-3-deoxy-D-gluconate 5-dehydrogenase KduD [Spirochaetales bacterium]|nr:MAG: 2-dehydro-3-deoxy-D-gluconate 5-dehydrogenase KduD [Spirochaetales bacterium]
MILEKFRLDGRVALITGSGTGLGEGIAVALAEAGADIAGVYNTHPPEKAKAEVEKLGRRFLQIQADLISIKPVPRIIESAVSHFGRLDILVNDAGIIRRTASLEYSEKDWDDVININLKSLFFLCQAAARQFLKQQSRGKIINIASLLSFQGGILIPAYTASKSGVRGLTQLLANEWARHNINVNAIAPGYMATSNTEPLRNDPKRGPSILARIPAGRWGTPEDLTGAAVFLASDAADYVNGITLAVDGGWLSG